MKIVFCFVSFVLCLINVEAQNNITIPLQNIDIEGKWISSTGKQFQVTINGTNMEYKNIESGDMFYCSSVGINVYKMVRRTDGVVGMNVLKAIDNNFIFNINPSGEFFLWRRLNNQNDIIATGNWKSSSGNIFKIRNVNNGIEYENINDKTNFAFNKVRPNEYTDQEGNYLFVVARNRIVRFSKDLTRKTEWNKEMGITDKIQEYVEINVNLWQKKGEFETTIAYKNRVSEQNRKDKIDLFTEEAIKHLKAEYAQTIRWNELKLCEYDADHETYLVKSTKFGDFAVQVPLADAPSFKKNWANMKFSNFDFSINAEQFNLAKVTITEPQTGNKYPYDSKQSTTYATNNIVYNFAPVEVDIPQNSAMPNQNIKSGGTVFVGLSDVDVHIPNAKTANPHAYALIIGNEDYSSFQSDISSEANVDFAVNDATVFKKYCINTFGVPESNIKFYANATGGQMNQAIDWINKIIQKESGDAEVIVYYAGHGLPDEQTHEPYIIPVDISGSNIQRAIKLQTLYSKLTEFPSKKITVFMDACFSGGSRGKGLLATRGVKIKPKEDVLTGNIVIFTSSSGEQSSLPFKDKQHGIFTYYLLKKMQETEGSVSYGELYDYVKKEVDLNCVKINSKEQTPDLLPSMDLGDVWKGWHLK
jgi:hypothetical protein